MKNYLGLKPLKKQLFRPVFKLGDEYVSPSKIKQKWVDKPEDVRIDFSGQCPHNELRSPMIRSLVAQYRMYKRQAEKRGLLFQVSLVEFSKIVSSSCVYCGDSISVGVDRRDSKLGYIEGNMDPCCGNCNMMKRAMKPKDFISHISKIHTYVNNL